MATCSVILTRVRGIVVWREFPCCVRVLCRDPRVFYNPLPTPNHCRSVHLTPGLSGKSYLHKFSSKNKKKHWHDSTWQFPVENKPPGLLALMKQQRAEKTENNARIKALNGILYDAITGLLRTSEVSEEVYDFCIELSKVSVSGDFSVCRAYWLSSGNKDTDDEIDKVLQKYAPRFRHLMISHRVLGNVPPVVFVRDKEDARRQQVEDLLAVLQFEEDKVSSVKTDVSRNLDTESVKEATVIQLPNIFGIDHAELNQQILAYKKKIKAIDVVTDSNEHSQRQKEQLAAIKKQNLLRKKMKTQKWSANDISPQDYLLVSAIDSDNQEELDFELHEDLVEVDEEEGTNGGST